MQTFATKTQSAHKDATNTQSGMCEGSHLSSQPVPSFLCKLHTYHMLLCHCKQSKYLRKCGGRQGGDKGITISHSAREPIVSSNRRTLSARNSARMMRCPIALPIGGFVLSWARPSPPATRINCDWATSHCLGMRSGLGTTLTSISFALQR